MSTVAFYVRGLNVRSLVRAGVLLVVGDDPFCKSSSIPCGSEQALAFFDQQAPVPAVRDDLHTTLDAVTAEQESRERLTRA